MDINFTFFVQVFHFFIAYKIIERLFCRPAITAIEKEQKAYSDLIAVITSQQQQLTQKETHKQSEWDRIKLFFSQSFPSLAKKETVQTGRTSYPTSLSPHEEQEYQQKIKELLIQRLRNVV